MARNAIHFTKRDFAGFDCGMGRKNCRNSKSEGDKRSPGAAARRAYEIEDETALHGRLLGFIVFTEGADPDVPKTHWIAVILQFDENFRRMRRAVMTE